MNRERMLSVMAGRASRVVTLKRPSDLIPFKGDFPILKIYDQKKYFELIKSTNDINDLPEKFKQIVERGNQIVIFDEDFADYLFKHGLSRNDFQQLSNSEKSDWLINWMSYSGIDFKRLTI